MKNSYLPTIAVVAVGFFLPLILSGAFYTVDQTEQVIITQFGQPVGEPITEPGLHFKIPFVQTSDSWNGMVLQLPYPQETRHTFMSTHSPGGASKAVPPAPSASSHRSSLVGSKSRRKSKPPLRKNWPSSASPYSISESSE